MSDNPLEVQEVKESRLENREAEFERLGELDPQRFQPAAPETRSEVDQATQQNFQA